MKIITCTPCADAFVTLTRKAIAFILAVHASALRLRLELRIDEEIKGQKAVAEAERAVRLLRDAQDARKVALADLKVETQDELTKLGF